MWNMFQMDLIHLGAKFAPCMRKDPNIDVLHSSIKENERNTGCCIYSDNSGCYQSSFEECNVSVRFCECVGSFLSTRYLIKTSPAGL